MITSTVLGSPTGPLLVEVDTNHGDGGTLTRLGFAPDRVPDPQPPTNPVLAMAAEQLAAYFAGELTTFDLPLAPAGTTFQQRVWQALPDIGYGRTESYARLAQRIGAPDAFRAVGAANGQNPLAIVVPCHRVVGSNGRLTGYAGGLTNKRLLLELEARVSLHQDLQAERIGR